MPSGRRPHAPLGERRRRGRKRRDPRALALVGRVARTAPRVQMGHGALCASVKAETDGPRRLCLRRPHTCSRVSDLLLHASHWRRMQRCIVCWRRPETVASPRTRRARAALRLVFPKGALRGRAWRLARKAGLRRRSRRVRGEGPRALDGSSVETLTVQTRSCKRCRALDGLRVGGSKEAALRCTPPVALATGREEPHEC